MKQVQKDEACSVIFTADSFVIDPACLKYSGKETVWVQAFKQNRFDALLQLGFEEQNMRFSASMNFLHIIATQFIKQLTSIPGLELSRETTQVELSEEDGQNLLRAVPFAIGANYINEDWLRRIFSNLLAAFSREITAYEGSVTMYLAEKSQHLRVPERIFFHLVESKEEGFPFAFLATYATKEKNGAIRHMPLQYALTEYKRQKDKLVELLSCLNKAAEGSTLIADMVESGEMFHPLRLTASEAYAFLKAIPVIEEAGILCRVPDWWKKKKSSASLSVKLGEQAASSLGFDTLISMQPSLIVDGVCLTEAEIQQLLTQTEGLALLKGKWIEVDHERLRKLLAEMEKFDGDITLRDALQIDVDNTNSGADVGPIVTNGAWLDGIMEHLRCPVSMNKAVVPDSFMATLRPYQETGYTWLNYMAELGFGACLADDMGLGKTVQVLAYLDHLHRKDPKARVLLIVPASLLGNWQKETDKFAPDLEIQVLHGKTAPVLAECLKKSTAFLTITTYGMAVRIKELQEEHWACVILDEAQGIKNPGTKQTKAIKTLPTSMRIAMTGTPIENDLTNLWSLFDFLNKGLLGTSKHFQTFVNQLDDNPQGYERLRSIVSPFILRRMKSDKSIIADLPDKLEKLDYIQLSKKQVVLYKKQVAEMEQKLQKTDGIMRRGLILATIIKLKQICNHPDQFLGQEGYAPEESGKFAMLRNICETIYEKRERVLVFTQFREIADYLASFLQDVFGQNGFVLHGGTRIARRTEMVEAFNSEEYIPFMVLSVKAGGTGLNLTGANHVIHFDRWWNPAVENQATDRVFRIGQQKNVVVHKFIASGTIEEKINDMIESKKKLAEQIVGKGGEQWITELDDAALLNMMKLDI